MGGMGGMGGGGMPGGMGGGMPGGMGGMPGGGGGGGGGRGQRGKKPQQHQQQVSPVVVSRVNGLGHRSALCSRNAWEGIPAICGYMQSACTTLIRSIITMSAGHAQQRKLMVRQFCSFSG